MRKLRVKLTTKLWLFALLVLLPLANPAAAEGSEIRFQRSNLLVSNLDQALEIYRDILGFTLEAVRDLPAEGYAYELFSVPAEASLRFAVLSSGTQTNVLALTEVSGPGSVARLSGQAQSASGLVLEVAEFDTVFSRLERMGLNTMNENKFLTADERDGRQRGFLDRDGNLIILYQLNGTGEPQ